MRQVLSDQHIANVVPVDSQITAGAPEVACARAFGTGPARAIHNLQIDVSAELDHLPEPRMSAGATGSLEATELIAANTNAIDRRLIVARRIKAVPPAGAAKAGRPL
jgi:hypothetical protein